MDNIILILGNQTEDIKRTLESYYKEQIEISNTFKTPGEFADFYEKTPVRVDRIIVLESSFIHDPYTELRRMREVLDNFYVVFDKCYFLLTNNQETQELLKFLVEDETFREAHRLRVFDHEMYTPSMVINYCINRIPRKHFIEQETVYDEVVRVRKGADTTFKLEELDDVENELVVLDRDNVTAMEISNKLRNLNSLSNILSEEIWENNKIIKDIYKLDKLMSMDKENLRFEIDYSNFYLKSHIKEKTNNIIIVTGERHSGKSTMAYSVAKSGSKSSKVLLVDVDTTNLGLSHLTETLADTGTIMLLQDFKNDFKNALRTLVNSDSKFNVLVSNTKTNKELGNIDPINFLSMIIFTCTKYFDNIIFDIPLTYINRVITLMKQSEKILVTVPTHVNNIVSTINLIKELSLTEDFLNEDLVFVPVDMFNKISGFKTLNGTGVKKLLHQVFDKKIKVMPEIEIKSFDLDDSLFKAIKSL